MLEEEDVQGDVSDGDAGPLIDNDVQMYYIPHHSSCNKCENYEK